MKIKADIFFMLLTVICSSSLTYVVGLEAGARGVPEKYKLVVVISPTFKYSKQNPGVIIDNVFADSAKVCAEFSKIKLDSWSCTARREKL